MQPFEPIPFDRPDEIILVWPGDDECVPQYNSQVIHVPPVNEVAIQADQKNKTRFRCGAAVLNGVPLPGTVVIRDVVVTDPQSGGLVKQFMAKEWLRGLQSAQPKLFERGLVAVTRPEDVERAQAWGRPHWEAAKAESWRHTLSAEIERQRHWKNKGLPVPPTSDQQAVDEAIAGLTKLGQVGGRVSTEADIFAALGGAPAAPPAAVVPSAIVPEPARPSVAELASKLFKAAQDNGVGLNKRELEGLMSGDAEVMDAVSQKVAAKSADARE